MGHQRLGNIPKTQRWTAVVEQIAGTGEGGAGAASLVADVDAVAAATLRATEAGLESAAKDDALCFSFYLLTQVVLAAREDDWQAGLSRHGISLDPESSLVTLASEFQRTVDNHIREHARRTTVGEIAQRAACEAITSLAASGASTLFGAGRDELHDAIRRLSTKAGFARVGQRFFGCFLSRFLNFYLSRVTAGAVGTSRLPEASTLSRFNDALVTHCRQSARIVHDFCGEWYSKTEFEGGITLGKSAAFVSVAISKLKAELKEQREAEL